MLHIHFFCSFFVLMKKKKKKDKTSKGLNPDLIKLGKRMRALRIKNRYTSFETFAYDNELPRVLYGNYEKGVGNITYKNLMKVIQALDISVSEFFSEGFD